MSTQKNIWSLNLSSRHSRAAWAENRWLKVMKKIIVFVVAYYDLSEQGVYEESSPAGSCRSDKLYTRGLLHWRISSLQFHIFLIFPSVWMYVDELGSSRGYMHICACCLSQKSLKTVYISHILEYWWSFRTYIGVTFVPWRQQPPQIYVSV